MARKAQISIQFNWLFILIVAVVILGFFFTVIKTQQERAEAEEASSIALTLDTVFSTITSNPDTAQSYPLSNADLEFTCEEGISNYYIQGTGPESTTNDILFTPNRLQGDLILTWTKTWETPFEAGVFTYVASDTTQFIFINDSGDDGLAEELYLEMPQTNESKPLFFRKTITETLEATTFRSGMDRYVIISTEEVDEDLIPEKRKEKTVIRNISAEQVTFRYPDHTRDYASRAALWGAIFTEDEQTYNCTMQKAIVRLNSNAAILHERAENMTGQHIMTQRCKNFFDDAKTSLQTLKDINTYDQADEIKTAAEALKEIQTIMMRGGACPHIY